MNVAATEIRPSRAQQAAVLRGLYRKLFFRRRGKNPNSPETKDPRRQTIFALAIYALLGCVSINFVALDRFAFAASLHAMTFMIAGMNLAISSGRLLFNPDETEVLLHRPIEPRLLLRCKLQVIVEFTLVLALALNLAGMTLAVWWRGDWLFLPAHLLSTTLSVIFCAGMVTLLYNICLRWFGRERLDNLMTATQVLFAASLMAGSQLIPRVVIRLDPAVFRHPPAWFAALPPAWFAALDLVLSGRGRGSGLLALAALGVGATSLAIWIGAGLLAGDYERGLAALGEAATRVRDGKGSKRQSGRLARLPLLRLWLRDPVERAAFNLTLAGLGRARDVKLRVFPILGQFLLSPTIILASVLSATQPADYQGIPPNLGVFQIAFGGAYIALIPLLVLEQLRTSDHWQATEIFHQAPLARPGALFHGARKAVLCVICVPGLLALAAVTCAWIGPRPQLLLLLPGAILAPVVSMLPGLAHTYVVFSEPPRVTRSAMGCLLLLGFMAGASVMAALCWISWNGGWFFWMVLGEAALAGVGYAAAAAVVSRQGLEMASD